jgi:hypothetical protein
VIIRDLQELQDLVFRTWVRSTMFLVTLPYHLSQEAARNPAPERAPTVARDRFRVISGRPPHGNGREDVRWLR